MDFRNDCGNNGSSKTPIIIKRVKPTAARVRILLFIIVKPFHPPPPLMEPPRTEKVRISGKINDLFFSKRQIIIIFNKNQEQAPGNRCRTKGLCIVYTGAFCDNPNSYSIWMRFYGNGERSTYMGRKNNAKCIKIHKTNILCIHIIIYVHETRPFELYFHYISTRGLSTIVCDRFHMHYGKTCVCVHDAVRACVRVRGYVWS